MISGNKAAYCVIGAGPCGLTASKNLLQRNIPFDCLEREQDLGGNWNCDRNFSSVFQSTHLISSKKLTEFIDFPMPENYPEYPGHLQVLAYFRRYAKHFGLEDRIQFNSSVDRIERNGGHWEVKVSGETQPRKYAGVVIANGHHWDPSYPEISGEFNGREIHSKEYKTPDFLTGKRVLVVGAGNSGCDIAVEAARHAQVTFHSLRRGYHFLPKFLFGKPIDRCGERLHRWHLPLWMRRWIASLSLRIAMGNPHCYGLPSPDHRLFETHPIINSQLPYFLGHGLIRTKPDVKSLTGDRVQFIDDSEEKIDIIIYATGYKLSFPFIDNEYLNLREGCPDLYLNVFHPHYDNLFFIGLIQPNGGIWGLADYQSQLVANFISAMESDPQTVEWLRHAKLSQRPKINGGIRYIESPRHRIEVEYFDYRKILQKTIHQIARR